ncbi:hypothetical protein [Aequorivita marina]|uniref:hypothetical protein n=1 Tax=Aequorivita marina TaxID=3073654 RepID=UPI0028744531|nr:hypothetical protein [Aequorivita sp. S2608]MDS1299476.1 hypothetical protein [Aequorivita sp. S2608]
MMKKSKLILKTVVFIFTFFSTAACYAQVGIGTTDPDGDALLELFSNNKGLLMPRVALTSTTSFAPLSAHVMGMTVYNTATNGSGVTAVSEGFYYNTGAKWIKVGNAIAGDQTDDAWINNSAENRIELGTLSDGTTLRPVGTEMVVTDNGKVGIGTEHPTQNLEIHGLDADIDTYIYGVNGVSIFHIHSAAGTMANPLAVSNRQTSNLFSIQAKGYDGTNYISAASISMGIDGVPNSTGPDDMPGRISFRTSQDGTTSLAQRMVIKNNGFVGIGTDNPKVDLEVNGMMKTRGYKVADLPAGVTGAMAYVTDAVSPQYLEPVIGQGTTICPVFYNGTNWVCH